MRLRQILGEDVFHASPHRFDKFSTDHIGTGEGKQIFGWGLYFASKAEVADHYQRFLARRFTYKGRSVDPESWLHSAIYALVFNKGDKDEAKGSWKPTSKVYQLIDQIDYSQIRNKTSIYKVQIPDHTEFLLWDETLNDQSQRVQTALRKLVKIPAEVEATVRPGQDAWVVWTERLQRREKDLSGEELYWTLAAQKGGEKHASLALLAEGVHGIKYYDARSRDMRDGTYNYVIFDGALVTIKQKNWKP